MVPELAKYLEDLSRRMRLDPARERQVIRELHSHLEDRVLELEAQGLQRREAVERAVQRFGFPKAVASEIYQVYSRGSWGDALLAAAPHVSVALLFSLGLWQSLGWLAAFLGVSVAVTLTGWWRGKPQWMYPWAGYALVLPLASGVIAALAVGQGGWSWLQGKGLGLPLAAYFGLLVYLPLSFGMLLSVLRQVVRRDWIFASLMMLPFPVLARWLLSFQMESSALVYSRPPLAPQAQDAIALVFLCLAAMPVLFVRFRQRPLKIAALIIATPPSFIVAASHIPGAWGFPWMAFFTSLAVAVLLTPALLDMAMARGHRAGLAHKGAARYG